MAVIKAVSSKAGIGHTIDYVTKKEKTEEKLVSGLHCEPETVKEEMQATKELWGKTDGRTYKHYVQSYHEDEEITPEQAHKNAVELAEQAVKAALSDYYRRQGIDPEPIVGKLEEDCDHCSGESCKV